jgi:tetratricopeptide (TPR) repeat protein
MKYKLFSHISAIVLPMLFVVLACFSCDNKESVMRIDHYNDVSYQNHYRSLETTKRYAQRALILAENIGYDDGKAEALNNLAFVSIAKMDYDKAYDLLNQVASTTDNTIELLVAKVQLMRLCQRQSENKNFYHHNQRALLYMRRIEEDKQLLDERQKARMVYARTEYDIVLSSYLYYVGQYEKSAECLNSIDPNGEIVKDTAQMLSYLYNVGAGGILKASSKAQLEQDEFDYLIRCYVLSRQYRFYFWEANSLQAMGDGITSMGELIIVTMLAGGMFEVVRRNGGIEYIIEKISSRISGKRGAESVIALLVAIVDVCTANNTVAIISVGNIAKRISQKYSIDNRRAASILDTSSCCVQAIIPYGAQMLMASGLSQLAPMEIIPYLYYPMALIVCVALSIVVRYPKKYA